MNGMKVGGINVFGGGLALYDADGDVIDAIGVSGDTSCCLANTRRNFSTYRKLTAYRSLTPTHLI